MGDAAEGDGDVLVGDATRRRYGRRRVVWNHLRILALAEEVMRRRYAAEFVEEIRLLRVGGSVPASVLDRGDDLVLRSHYRLRSAVRKPTPLFAWPRPTA